MYLDVIWALLILAVLVFSDTGLVAWDPRLQAVGTSRIFIIALKSRQSIYL